MDSAATQFDEEEHVQPLQPDRVNGEEVDREQASPVRVHEFVPRHATACADWPESRCAKPGAYRRRRDREPKARQLAHDALIAPARIVSREAQNQFSDL